jgi:uncharacterized membrane protein YdjX (TVP38/TMEM64 family)
MPTGAKRGKLAAATRLAVLPAVVLVTLLIAWKLGYFELDRRQRLFETVQRLRVLPGVEAWFFLSYAVGISLGLPSAVLATVAGAVFGFRLGAPIAWSASLLGTALAYGMARTVAKNPIRRLFGEHRLMRRFKKHDDVLTLTRLRVVPAGPFAVFAYVAGVAGVSLRRLLIATAIGILPSDAAYAYLGSAILAGSVSAKDASGRAVWIAGGVTVAVLLLSLVAGRLDRGD